MAVIRKTTIWIRMDPLYWWDSDTECRGLKWGQVRKTRPPREENANWVRVEVAVNDDRFRVAINEAAMPV